MTRFTSEAAEDFDLTLDIGDEDRLDFEAGVYILHFLLRPLVGLERIWMF